MKKEGVKSKGRREEERGVESGGKGRKGGKREGRICRVEAGVKKRK